MSDMKTQMKPVEILKKNHDSLRDNFGVKRIGLFGSFAKGTERKDSDIDMVVEFKNADFDNFMNLVFYLEKLLGRKVDILTPEGLRSIRVKKVAEDIERSLRYV